MDRRAINPDTLAPGFGYSQLVSTSGGRTLYIAGQVAFDENGALVGAGDFEAQARQVFLNLSRALTAGDATPSDIVKLGIFVVDHDLDRLSIIRDTRDAVLGLDHDPPASTLLGVQALALPDLLVEVDAIAVIP
jgi:enamine deaminase RidA (YjgF/YER057c/UK114 family)